jgi:hypothetical protein
MDVVAWWIPGMEGCFIWQSLIHRRVLDKLLLKKKIELKMNKKDTEESVRKGITLKQHITLEQLQELTPEQKKNLRAWWKPQEGDLTYIEEHWGNCISRFLGFSFGAISLLHFEDISSVTAKSCLPILNIGQMIELISYKTGIIPEMRGIKLGLCEVMVSGVNTPIQASELCDSLWEAVKSIL